MKYVISAREFSGTSTEVIAQLSELIEALMAVRLTLERESAMSLRPPRARARAALVFLVLAAGLMSITGFAAPAAAQTEASADPNPGRMTLTGSLDGVSTYMFRGIRQHSTGTALWPVADLGLAVYSGDGGLKSVGINIGNWSSLHTGDTGADGPTGKLWYESDVYTTLSLGFGGGASLATTFTAYTSPNNAFTTVKEIMFKLGIDDSAYLGKGALKPYAAVAFEFDTEPGVGQADGGAHAGRYLEFGVAPGYAGSRASLSVPVKVGISLADYYELNTGSPASPAFVDHKFGYFSVAGLVTVPLGGTTGFGTWNLHGGVEYQALGDTTKAFNGGDSSRVIFTVGFGFTY